MAKTRIRMKIKEFEFEMDGEIAAPQAGQQIGQQFTKLLEAGITANQPQRKHVENTGPIGDVEIKPSGGKKSRRPGSGAGGKDVPAYQHDGNKFGEPRQDWNPTKKCLWLLRCVDLSGQPAEFTPGQVANLFNAHFKSFGKLRASNVSRDLSKESAGGPNALFIADGERYSLAAKGKKDADKLVAEVTAAPTAGN